MHDADQLARVRKQRETVPLLTSVCTGSLVYAAAGLLRGRPATTHWLSPDLLAELDPTIDVRRDERFVDDGDIVTSAGVSAGIDMALHLLARLVSPERAREVREHIQYAPEPPVRAPATVHQVQTRVHNLRTRVPNLRTRRRGAQPPACPQFSYACSHLSYACSQLACPAP